MRAPERTARASRTLTPRRAAPLAVALGLLGAAGCDLVTGSYPCEHDDNCPTGAVCAAGTCHAPPAQDAGVGRVDAGPVDAGAGSRDGGGPPGDGGAASDGGAGGDAGRGDGGVGAGDAGDG